MKVNCVRTFWVTLVPNNI